MKKSKIIIELTSGQLDVLVYDGESFVAREQVAIQLPDDANAWATNVRRSAQSLRELVQRMELTGQQAYVLYRSPTQAVDVHSLAVKSEGHAIEAARLSCFDSLSYTAMSAVCEGQIVGRDAGSDRNQCHVVVAAEREDIAQAIACLVQESGLMFEGATPFAAAVASTSVASVLADNQPCQAKLYIGNYSSLFLIGHQGQLLFSRRIGLGLESLARSMTRPIRVSEAAGEVELTFEQANALLQEYGIPGRDAVIDPQQQLKGLHVLPLIQPVLQRFIVELRQSIRFGLDEADRQNLTIRLAGPGAGIAGFCELINEELNVESTCDAEYSQWDFTSPGTDPVMLKAILSSGKVFEYLNLQPRELAKQRRVRMMRRWLWTGAAAALVLVGVDAMRYQVRLSNARHEADVHATQIADLEALQATGKRLQSSLAAMNNLEQQIESQVGRRIDFHACMQELSRITPEGIRFDLMEFQPMDGRTVGKLSGYAIESQKDAAQVDLERCIDALRNSPLFDEVVLNRVQRGSVGDMEGQRFGLTFVVCETSSTDRKMAMAQGGEKQ